MTSIRKEKKQAPSFKTGDYEDMATINSVLQGNKNSFDRLYKKYYPLIFRSIQKNLLGTKYRYEDAKDITAEILIKIFENLDKYEKDYTFNAWASKVAKNHLVDCFRRDKKYNGTVSIDAMLQSDDSSDIIRGIEDSSIAPAMESDEKIEKIAMLNVIYNAMNTFLPDIEREIMELYYFHDLTYQEICDKLKIKLNFMKVRLLRAKNKLKSKIKLKRAMVEVASVYSLEQINIDKMYKLNQEIFLCE